MVESNQKLFSFCCGVFFLAILAGCNSTNNSVNSDALEAHQSWQNRKQMCRRNPDSKHAVANITCLKNAYRVWAPYDQHPEITRLVFAKAAVAAEKFEKGQLSAAEYELAIQEAGVGGASAVASEDNARAIADSQQQIANAARVQQFYNMQRMINQNTYRSAVAPTPLPVVPTVSQPVNTNCIVSGNVVNCSSY